MNSALYSSSDVNLLHLSVSKHLIHSYTKDRNGNYLECNDNLASDTGFSNPEDMLGLCDFDLKFLTTDEKKCLRNNDIHVMKQSNIQTFMEPVTLFDNRKVICVSQKMPAYSKAKKVVGVRGISLIFERIHFQTGMLFYFKNNIANFLSLYSNYLYYLTPREIEVLYHLIRGKSLKKIGDLLEISPRTSEQHLENIKLKLNLDSKEDIIEKIIDSIFAKN